MNWHSIISNPLFWGEFIAVAAKQTEKASPDYTVAHKVAAFVGHVMGEEPISVPDAAHAENLAQAIAEGVKQVFTSTIQVQPQAAVP